MVERKLYKTKLCLLYQRGRCHRQSCSFAHGDAELRRFSAPLAGRRGFRGCDLREKLDRRRSPLRRYSPDRDARERHASRGRSHSESAGRRSDRKHRLKHSDGQSDISGSLNMSDGTENHVKDQKHLSSNSKYVLQQLRQLQSETDMLDDHKRELEVNLEERTHQADSLALKNQELEMELSKEKDECKRITSMIKKFMEAYNDHSRLEGELKRSQAKLQKLTDKLGLDLVRNGATGEDLAIHSSDGEVAVKRFRSWDEQQNNISPTKRMHKIHLEADETSNQASTKGKGAEQRIAYHTQLNKEKKGYGDFNSENGYMNLVGEDKSKKGTNHSSDVTFNKPRASDIALVLPSTSMAAHAVDEDAEVEMEEKPDIAGNVTNRGKGSASDIPEYPFLPPPPPLPRSAYLQYKVDENENVDALDEEMLEVDIV